METESLKNGSLRGREGLGSQISRSLPWSGVHPRVSVGLELNALQDRAQVFPGLVPSPALTAVIPLFLHQSHGASLLKAAFHWPPSLPGPSYHCL